LELEILFKFLYTDCRIIGDQHMQFLVSWAGFDDCSWEPFDNLRLNITFQKYIKEKFEERETDIYVNLASFKERLKSKIRYTLRNQLKFVTMLDILPFDPFEYKVRQVVYHLINVRTEKMTEYLEDMVFRNYFFKLEEVQRIKHDKLIEKIQKIDNIKFTIENDIDFDDPPNFEYISKNFLADQMNETVFETDVFLTDFKGCKCKTEECSKENQKCCPRLLKKPFSYKYDSKDNPILRLKFYEEIIECNDLCSCGPNCLNRVSQQRNNVPLCLFKTETRGWGIKAATNIKKGTFILEYVGEILGHHEAGKREQTEFLFDLNLDRKSYGFYTIGRL
jgi:[histone H3]-lysine9 N-trimethyltransferase SUV39H